MKTRIQTSCPSNCGRAKSNLRTGFTLTDLLVVLAAVALLAVMALPAFAGARIKGARALCAGNLHQMFVASMLYADEYGTKLPPWRAGDPHVNDVSHPFYTRYVYWGVNEGDKAPMSFSLPPGCAFQNMGYLYGAKLAGDGNIFYCPAMPIIWPNGAQNPYSAACYSPLLTCAIGPRVRSSYNYNPRIINAGPPVTDNPNMDTHRRYQKTTQFEPHKVFGNDAFFGGNAHSEDQGLNVVFTDGSVKFCKSNVPQIVNSRYGNLWKQAQTENGFPARELLSNIWEGM